MAGENEAGPWSVERRFRVTEVFLAVLWVWTPISLPRFILEPRIGYIISGMPTFEGRTGQMQEGEDARGKSC